MDREKEMWKSEAVCFQMSSPKSEGEILTMLEWAALLSTKQALGALQVVRSPGE